MLERRTRREQAGAFRRERSKELDRHFLLGFHSFNFCFVYKGVDPIRTERANWALTQSRQ